MTKASVPIANAAKANHKTLIASPIVRRSLVQASLNKE
jgi:hypothetical protein